MNRRTFPPNSWSEEKATNLLLRGVLLNLLEDTVLPFKPQRHQEVVLKTDCLWLGEGGGASVCMDLSVVILLRK